MAAEDQVHADLVLPDMCHFVDEKTLIIDALPAEIFAIERAFGVKINMSARGHDDMAWLEKGPFVIA